MAKCVYVIPPNGRGYGVDVDGDHAYKPDGSPWCLGELPMRLDWQGYYWSYVDGRATLIMNRRDLKDDWTFTRWVRLRRMWSYLVAVSGAPAEGLGFSFNGGPAELHGWLCVAPVRIGIDVGGAAELLGNLAYQLDELHRGSYKKVWAEFKEHRHMISRLRQISL